MKLILSILFLIALFAISPQASAELNAGDLYQICKDYDSHPQSESASNLACLYYVQGNLDGKSVGFFSGYLAGRIRGKSDDKQIQETAIAEAYQAKKANFDIGFCSEYKSLNQYILVIVRYLQNHPENYHLHASTEINMALSQAFPLPCQ